MQDSLIISPLAAVNNVPQHESKCHSDEKLGFDGAEGQRGLRREGKFAQVGHLEKSILEIVGSFRDRPLQGRAIKFVQLGNPLCHSNGCIDGDDSVKFNQW